ncbi:hypothetical protein BU17DRAFT_14750, partial [Hysterangium stoloniferum]
ACSLQSCLNKNTYRPDRCHPYLIALYECCQAMYETDPAAESAACPMKQVVTK